MIVPPGGAKYGYRRHISVFSKVFKELEICPVGITRGSEVICALTDCGCRLGVYYIVITADPRGQSLIITREGWVLSGKVPGGIVYLV